MRIDILMQRYLWTRLLLMSRIFTNSKPRTYILAVAMLFSIHQVAHPQVDVNTEGLYNTLKEIQRIRRKIVDTEDKYTPILLFQLGVQADTLASLLTRQRRSHGNAVQKLIDLILERASEVDVDIAWHPLKKRYFYDGAAFHDYIRLAPDGTQAVRSKYELLELDFFRSTGNDLNPLRNAAKNKNDFISRYPNSEFTGRVRIMLAIEYRDIARIYNAVGDYKQAERYISLSITEARRLVDSDSTEQEIDTAETLIERIQEEFQTEQTIR